MKAEVTREQAVEFLQQQLTGTINFEHIVYVIANKVILECQLASGKSGDFISLYCNDKKHVFQGTAYCQAEIEQSFSWFMTFVGTITAQYFLVHTPLTVYEEEEIRKVLRKREKKMA